MKKWLFLVVLTLVVAPSLLCAGATQNPTARRRAVGRESCVTLFKDLDADGRGNLAEPRTFCGPVSAQSTTGYVADASDCNDSDPSVFQTVNDLVPDCNLDGYADDLEVYSVCVGNPKPIIYFCAEGSCVRMAYVGSNGILWIPSKDAKHDVDGKLIQDPNPGCPFR